MAYRRPFVCTGSLATRRSASAEHSAPLIIAGAPFQHAVEQTEYCPWFLSLPASSRGPAMSRSLRGLDRRGPDDALPVVRRRGVRTAQHARRLRRPRHGLHRKGGVGRVGPQRVRSSDCCSQPGWSAWPRARCCVAPWADRIGRRPIDARSVWRWPPRDAALLGQPARPPSSACCACHRIGIGGHPGQQQRHRQRVRLATLARARGQPQLHRLRAGRHTRRSARRAARRQFGWRRCSCSVASPPLVAVPLVWWRFPSPGLPAGPPPGPALERVNELGRAARPSAAGRAPEPTAAPAAWHGTSASSSRPTAPRDAAALGAFSCS